ncbi:MAG: hypothetical protein KDC46_09460 [Thermoleophilia bacterium]|nr:hypothetical protein [Thermoleophilia bacterium]
MHDRNSNDPGETNVLVRAGNEGEWLQLQPVHGAPEGGIQTLLGSDAANLLELDEPLPVAAYGPWPQGAAAGIDAVCITPRGDIELVVATWDEDPRDTLWRMADVAGTLRGTTLDAFAAHCSEIGSGQSVAAWVQARVGGDVRAIEHRLAQVLDAGEFGFMLLTPRGAGALAQPLAWMQRSAARVRVFELAMQRAGAVQAIEGTEVPLDHADSSGPATPAVTEPARPELQLVPDETPARAEAEAAPRPEAAPEPAPAPEQEATADDHGEDSRSAEAVVVAIPAPDPEPEAELQPEPEAEVEPEAADQPQPEAQPEPEEAAEPDVQLEPSTVEAFFEAVDKLDHRTTSHVRWLHESLLKLVDDAEYVTDGELVHVAGWLQRDDKRLALFGLDSQGVLQLVLSTLPEHEQLEFADEVAGLLPDGNGDALMQAGFAEIDVPANLDDQTLLEYLVDNLVEALPGGRELFGTGPDSQQPAAQADSETEAEDSVDEVGDDFFAGVSAGNDPDEVQSALDSNGLEDTTPPSAHEDPAEQAEQPAADTGADEAQPAASVEPLPKPAYEPPAPEPKPKKSRWRRRGAA